MSAQNTRAKILIVAFEKQIDVANKALEQNFFKTAEGKIASLERSLESIKKKDPSYDTSSLEQKLNDLKEKCGTNKTETLTQRSNDKEQYRINVDAYGQLDDYVRSVYLPKDKAEELSKIDFTKLDITKYRASMVEITETSIDRRKNGFQDDIERHRQAVKNYYPGEAEKAYEAFLDQKRQYDYAIKLFPGEPILEKVQKQFQSLFDELGDIETIKKAAEAEGVKTLANRRMPAAVIKDANIESLFKKAFDNESVDSNWERTSLKINLTNRDWVISKNSLTGAILGRKRYAAIAFKDVKTGKCKMISDFTIYQQYNGSGFNANPQGTSMVSSEILCENVNK